MDDTLPASQVREIGQQVNETPYARDLVERIRRSTRKRRLTIPPSTGPDAVDPNLLASYVDNTLDPVQVAEFEKRCLASEVHLAEAASVHQILSLLGQRAKVPAEARFRMYRIIKGPEAVARHGARPVGSVDHDEPEKALSSRPMEEPETPGSWQRLVPASLATLVVAGLLISTWAGLSNPTRPSAAPLLTRDDLVTQALKKNVVRAEAPPRGVDAALPPGDGVSEAETPAPTVASNDPSAVVAQGEPKGEGEESTKIALRENSKADAAAENGATAKEAIAKPNPKGEAESSDRTAVKSDIPAGSSGRLSDTNGVVLRELEQARSWEKMKADAVLGEQNRIVNLGTGRAEIDLRRGKFLLAGEADLKFDGVEARSDARVKLDSGRMVYQAGNRPLPVLLQDPEGGWCTIESDPGGVIGLERILQLAPGNDAGAWLAVSLPSGEVKVRRGANSETLSGPGTFLVSTDAKPIVKHLDQSPEWVEAPAATPIESELAAQLGEKFSQELPPISSLLELVDDLGEGSKRLRPMAVSALARLGQVDLVVDALNTQNNPTARRAAIGVLRNYAMRDAASLADLRSKLTDFGQAEWAGLVESLLAGLPTTNPLDPTVIERLRDLLKHSDVGVRELALENLMRLFERRDDLGYNPDAPEEGPGLDAWEDLIRQVVQVTAPPRATGAKSKPANGADTKKAAGANKSKGASAPETKQPATKKNSATKTGGAGPGS
jgi:hypothetical protein